MSGFHWSAEFVGLPWAEKGRSRAGVDCWGLFRLAYQEVGVELPSYTEAYASPRERAEIEAAIRGSTSKPVWTKVEPGAEREWDGVTFRVDGREVHIGLVVRPGRMLHIDRGRLSCIARYDAQPWASRLVGIYRHADLAAGICLGPLAPEVRPGA